MRIETIRANIEKWVKNLKKKIGTLYFAYRDRRTPIVAKGLAVLVVAYALSPIDLVPDFIPVLGYLDDMILLPLGIALAVRLIPNEILKSSTLKAEKYFAEVRKPNWFVGSVIILLWITFLLWIISRLVERFA